jgi:hypothetical protein
MFTSVSEVLAAFSIRAMISLWRNNPKEPPPYANYYTACLEMNNKLS